MATAAITGTVTDSVNESAIVAGAKTLIITLTGDTWIAAAGETLLYDGEIGGPFDTNWGVGVSDAVYYVGRTDANYGHTSGTWTITRVSFRVHAVTGDISSKTYTAKIWQTTAAESALPANPVTNGTSTGVSGSSISAGTWVDFTFSGSPTMAPSTYYAITMDPDGATSDGSNYFTMSKGDAITPWAAAYWAKAKTLGNDAHGSAFIKIYGVSS